MLVDNRTVMREGLRALIEQQPDLEVVADVPTVAVAEASVLQPDVIVTEVILPDAAGEEVIHRLGQAHPRSRILALTLVENPADVESVLAAGANGYVLKTAGAGDLLAGIGALASGEDYVQASLARDIEAWRSRDTVPKPTPREAEVMRLIASGHTNAEVANLLGMSRRTVETHRRRINRKLGVRTRAELFRYAWRAGLFESGPP